MSAMPLRIAILALGRNKVRSSLTMLGVIIGVAAVIAMVAIGSGATQSVQKQIATMGQNMLMIMPGSSSSGAVMFGAGSVQTLTPNDALAIQRECPSVAAVSVTVRARAQIVYQDVNWAPATVQGCDPEFLVVRQWPIVEGEGFSDQDLKNAAQVCLLGMTVVDNLFHDESPVGKRIRVKGLPFRVVGVLDKKGANTFGSDQDDVLLLPWTTCKKKLQGSSFNNVDQLLVSAVSPEAMTALEGEIRDVLRATHRLTRDRAGAVADDFTIRNMTELLGAMTATTGVMTSLLAAIASVSLLVGGIGIMNIMLVSVTERTREIGLRMAVGATGTDVLSQFLVESIVLSGIGGLLGIGAGVGGALAVANFAHWPVVVSAQAIAVAVLFSAAVGVMFGFYPAWRASRLDPIDALRYE
jgi:ABC-type antimicrobial peptide transport system permease subunit